MKNRIVKTNQIILGIGILFISFSCNNMNSDWEKAKSTNSVEGFQEFLKNYPKSDFANSAQNYIDSLEWINIKIGGSIEDYQTFQSEHLDSKIIENVNVAIDSLQWISILKSDSVEMYESYVSEYPAGKHISAANVYLQQNLSSEYREILSYTIFRVVKIMDSNNPFIDVSSSDFSNSVEEQFKKFNDISFDLEFHVNGLGSIMRIEPGDKISVTYPKPHNYKISFTRGVIGEKGGNVYIGDGTIVSFNSVKYMFNAGRWRKV